MKTKKYVEMVLNHPNFKKGYNTINRIYFNTKNNSIILTGITNNKQPVNDLSPLLENIILSYKLTGYPPPKFNNIILNIYNKRGEKLSTVTLSC